MNCIWSIQTLISKTKDEYTNKILDWCTVKLKNVKHNIPTDLTYGHPYWYTYTMEEVYDEFIPVNFALSVATEINASYDNSMVINDLAPEGLQPKPKGPGGKMKKYPEGPGGKMKKKKRKGRNPDNSMVINALATEGQPDAALYG